MNNKRKYNFDNVDPSRQCDRDQKKSRERRMFALGVFLLMFAAFGIAMFAVHTINYFRGNSTVQLNPMLGKPGAPIVVPAVDFSDMNQTLEGIERQLERMNDIQLKIQQERR